MVSKVRCIGVKSIFNDLEPMVDDAFSEVLELHGWLGVADLLVMIVIYVINWMAILPFREFMLFKKRFSLRLIEELRRLQFE